MPASYMSPVRHPTLLDQAILSACFTYPFCLPLYLRHIFLISPCKTQESSATVMVTDLAQCTKNRCSPAPKAPPMENIEATNEQGTMTVVILVSCPALLACRLAMAIFVCSFASHVCSLASSARLYAAKLPPKAIWVEKASMFADGSLNCCKFFVQPCPSSALASQCPRKFGG